MLPIGSCPVTGHPWKSLCSIFFEPSFQIFMHIDETPPESSLGKPVPTLSDFHQTEELQTIHHFNGLFCSPSSVWSYLILPNRGAGSLPSLAGSTPNVGQGGISLLCCKGTLLVHVQLGDQQVLSCKLLSCYVLHSMGLYLPRCRILHFPFLNVIKFWRLILLVKTEGIQYLSLSHIPCHQGPAPFSSNPMYARQSLDILCYLCTYTSSSCYLWWLFWDSTLSGQMVVEIFTLKGLIWEVLFDICNVLHNWVLSMLWVQHWFLK